MKLKGILTIVFIFTVSFIRSQKNEIDEFKTQNGIIKVHPILHGSLVLTYNNTTVYVDPYGGSDLYKSFKSPDIVLITDIHGDHLDHKTLDAIDTSNAIFITPKEVASKLPKSLISKIEVLKNGQGIHRLNIFFKAIAMYNLPEVENSKHPKGRGNGYVLNIDDKQLYISGDTEDIPEMRTLQHIDIAFICMNLPYTMDINQAASAVLEFQPKVVYPYHYRGADGLSDIKEFKKLVNAKNKNIEVRLRNWYPKN